MAFNAAARASGMVTEGGFDLVEGKEGQRVSKAGVGKCEIRIFVNCGTETMRSLCAC